MSESLTGGQNITENGKLLPCPFCGGEAECHQWWSATISGKYATVCTKCNCGTDYYANEAEAVDAWNTRAERTCKLTLDGTDGCFGCSRCYENIPPLSNYCPNCGAKVVGE